MKDAKIESLRIGKENFGRPMRFRFAPDIASMEFLAARMPENIMPEMEITYLATYNLPVALEDTDLDKPIESCDRELLVADRGMYLPDANEWIFLFAAPYKNTLYHVFERVQ